MPLPLHNDLVTIISADRNIDFHLALVLTAASYRYCAPVTYAL